MQRLFCFLLLLTLAVPVLAQSPPAQPNWGAASTAIVHGLIPIVRVVLPIYVGLFVLMAGPKIIKRMVHNFAVYRMKRSMGL
jgi:hypothetical protein